MNHQNSQNHNIILLFFFFSSSSVFLFPLLLLLLRLLLLLVEILKLQPPCMKIHNFQPSWEPTSSISPHTKNLKIILSYSYLRHSTTTSNSVPSFCPGRALPGHPAQSHGHHGSHGHRAGPGHRAPGGLASGRGPGPRWLNFLKNHSVKQVWHRGFLVETL